MKGSSPKKLDLSGFPTIDIPQKLFLGESHESNLRAMKRDHAALMRRLNALLFF